MGSNPFSGQNITGLYDNAARTAAANLSSALQNQSSNKRTFQESINNAIRVANSATQSKANRLAEQARMEFQQDQLNKRLERTSELQFQNQSKLRELDRKNELQDTSSLLSNLSEIRKTFDDPEMAKSASQSLVLESLSANPSNPQIRGIARSTFGVDDTGLDEVIGLAQTGQFKAGQNSYLGRTAEKITAENEFINAKREDELGKFEYNKSDRSNKLEKQELEIQEKEAEVANKVASAKSVENLHNLVNSTVTGEAEAGFLNSVIDRRERLLATGKAGASKYAASLDEYNKSAPLIGSAVDSARKLRDKLTQLQEAGGSFNVKKNAIKRGIPGRILGNQDAQRELDNALKEENFIVNGGRMDKKKTKELKTAILTEMDRLVSRATAINRSVFQNVGTQTDKDFEHGLGAFFKEGNSLDTVLNSLTSGTRDFEAMAVSTALYHGDEFGFKNEYRRFKEDGGRLDTFGVGQPVTEEQRGREIINQRPELMQMDDNSFANFLLEPDANDNPTLEAGSPGTNTLTQQDLNLGFNQ